MKGFNFGIIGAANIASRFCDAVNNIDNATVVAVGSCTPNKAKEFALKNNIESYYDGYEELVKRNDIDAIYIATTHNFHYENIMLALNNNKHVLCEKAFVLNKAQALEIFKIAKEKNLFCMEAMWSRFLPVILKAKEWIDTGRLGEIDMANFIIGFHSDENPEGRMRNPKLGGGAMYDIGVYAIELMQYLIPEKIIDVTSKLSYTKDGVDKVDNITIQFENCIAALQAVMTCEVQQALNIYGTKGRIYIENPHFADSCTLYDRKGISETFYARRDNGFEYEIEELIRCVKDGKIESDIIPHKDTLLCAEIFDKCFNDNRNGGK